MYVLGGRDHSYLTQSGLGFFSTMEILNFLVKLEVELAVKRLYLKDEVPSEYNLPSVPEG